MTRRSRRSICFAAGVVLISLVVVSCGGDEAAPGAPMSAAPPEPTAGRWDTWVLESPGDIVVAPPPEEGSDAFEADRSELERQTASPSPEVLASIQRWSGGLPTAPWTETAFDFVSQAAKDPPLSSRNYALVHVAIHDAVVAAWHNKALYGRSAPQGVETAMPAGTDPSYPSEHAAIAGAASRVLAQLYPNQSALRLEEMAEEAAASRVQAGTNTPSDVAAGLDLGRQVAERVLEKARTDGADRPWDPTRPPGIGRGPAFWEPPPGSDSPPISPQAGGWDTWVLKSGSQLRPPPPPAFGSADFEVAARELIDMQKNLTPEQEELARFYEGAEGSELPAGIVLRVVTDDLLRASTAGPVEQRLSTPRVTRALALVSVALADAGIAAWDAKFTYWNPRPENAIVDLGLDRRWKPLLPTPRFPAYPSGSAGYAGAAQEVMTYLFPEDAATFERRAHDQAESRLYAGIHWRYDSASLETGRQIGRMVVERARSDGADTGA